MYATVSQLDNNQMNQLEENFSLMHPYLHGF